MVVFTSDHGDYLGDHWLGEKYLFHDQSVRVPLIIVAPSAAADGTRGTGTGALVELIDLARPLSRFSAARRPRISSKAARCCRSFVAALCRGGVM